MKILKYGKYWAVYDFSNSKEVNGMHTAEFQDKLVCVTVYKKGAEEVVKRLEGQRKE